MLYIVGRPWLLNHGRYITIAPPEAAISTHLQAACTCARGILECMEAEVWMVGMDGGYTCIAIGTKNRVGMH